VKKLTKAQAKRRMNEIEAKASKLFMCGFISLKDLDAIQRIIKMRMGKL
jgi:hypothetical protein|tara:strand:- start:1866 stop:2012 length:147 start_codon:yes stop_codon:yes gene_type:complete